MDKLIQRERRQFEPTAPARVPFSATEAMAVMMLTGVYAVVTHATGMNLRILEWLAAMIQGRWRFTRLSESSAGASRSGFGDSGDGTPCGNSGPASARIPRRSRALVSES